MRRQRQSGAGNCVPRSGDRRDRTAALLGAPALFVVLALVCALVWGAPAALAARPSVRHACDASPAPGHAACLAMRLLMQPTGAAAPSATPQVAGRAGAVTDSKPFPGFLTPQLLREAYGLPEETAAGSTQTIAIIDSYDDPTAESDLGVYSEQFGLPPCTTENGCFRKVNQKGEAAPLPKVDGGWASEISIDVQMAHGICQSCRILLVEAKTEQFSDLGAAVNTAAKLGAGVVSNSYGGTEEAGLAELESSAYNHPGILLTVSSGDCGFENEACAEDEAGANFPASSPHVLSVGGTSLAESGGVWTSTVWDEGGSGCSTLFNAPFWESGVGNFAATGCGSDRAIADVAAIGDPQTGVDVYDSTPDVPGARTGWGAWGGTSVAAPIVAGEFALAGGSQGVSYPAATIYGHAGEAGSLYDVVSGSNGVCGTATICKAAAGFDGPTGLGSPVGLGAFDVAGTPKSTSPPTIAGYPEQGLALEAHHGGWTGSPSTYSHQWERCGFLGPPCQAIPGATAPSYTPLGEDVGHAIRVREGASNSAGSGYEDSAAIGPVVSNVPTVSSFSPASGLTGSTVIVKGNALDSTSQVLLGSLAASFTVVSPTTLELTVPNGTKKGKITVTTPHGSVTGNAKFTATFSITAFSPQSAAAGARVTIKGVGFTPSSAVSFAGTPAASVTYVNKKKLRAIVPAGAGAGPVTVTNTEAPAGTVSSAGPFTP